MILPWRVKRLIATYAGFCLIAGLSLLCSACGFHLRGMANSPNWLSEVMLDVRDAHRELGVDVENQLRAYHISIASSPETAHYFLLIERDDEDKRITSVSSSTTPRQYQLIYRVQFKLQDKNNQDVVPQSAVIVTRLITVNSDRILGSNYEEELLRREMRHDAATQIINRLEHAPS